MTNDSGYKAEDFSVGERIQTHQNGSMRKDLEDKECVVTHINNGLVYLVFDESIGLNPKDHEWSFSANMLTKLVEVVAGKTIDDFNIGDRVKCFQYGSLSKDFVGRTGVVKGFKDSGVMVKIDGAPVFGADHEWRIYPKGLINLSRANPCSGPAISPVNKICTCDDWMINGCSCGAIVRHVSKFGRDQGLKLKPQKKVWVEFYLYSL